MIGRDDFSVRAAGVLRLWRAPRFKPRARVSGRDQSDVTSHRSTRYTSMDGWLTSAPCETDRRTAPPHREGNPEIVKAAEDLL